MNDLSLSRPELIALIGDLKEAITELVHVGRYRTITSECLGTEAALAAIKLAQRAGNVLEAEEKALEEWRKHEFGDDEDDGQALASAGFGTDEDYQSGERL